MPSGAENTSMGTYAHETPRLWLQKLTVEEHLEDFHELWDNPEALTWSTQNVKENLEEARAWMLTTLASPENPDIDKYALLLKPIEENPKPWVNAKGRPKMIGMTGTNRWSEEGMETGYCVNVKYWGRGYAGEGFRGFLECFWGLDERRAFKRLVAKVDPGNVASLKIIERAGGKKAGVLKDWYARAVDNGVKRDIDFYWIDRPGVKEKEMEEWEEEVKRQMVRKRDLEKEKEDREKAEHDNEKLKEKIDD